MENAPPVIDFAPYVAECTRGFTGRRWAFEDLHEWLRNPARPRFYLLTGEPGSGKTACAVAPDGTIIALA